MTLQWVSADLRTGAVLLDLPNVEPDWPLRRTIGRYESATVKLWLDDAPPTWEYAVREGGAVLACYDDEDDTRSIQWAGMVLQQTRDTANGYVELGLATGEAYFDRRYVGDKTYLAHPQNLIVADLVSSYVVDGSEPGIPIALDYGADDGVPRDRAFLDTDSATVYTRLTQLMATLGGPEFTVEWDWYSGGEFLFPTLVVGARIGAAKPADRDPDALFDMPGCVKQAVQVRDYGTGKGANKVTAFSSGQGKNTPTSGPVRVVDTQGRPTFEYRWTPSSSITDTATLVDYARQAAALLAPGARSMALTAVIDEGPSYGRDWRLGDDVAYQVGGLDSNNNDTVPMFPGGLKGYGRAIAYELSNATVSPILAEADVYSDESEAA